MTKQPYTKPGRLADVLALIQVLAFDPHAHRSESGINEEPGGIKKELGKPSSSPEGWIALAREHPEFFRVSGEGDHPLSLVARHVHHTDQFHKRAPLSQEFTNVLITTAIELHDRQMEAAAWWRSLMPLWVALLAGGLTIASSIATLRWGHSLTSGRFVHVGDPYPRAILLDTATGQHCYGAFAGEKNTFNIPNCTDLR